MNSSRTRRRRLWRRDWIERARVARAPELTSVVVAVDPPVTATAASDACGIVVAGIGPDGRAYVVADRTVQGREPTQWARAAIAAYRDFMADRIVAEVNQGGDLVVGVLRQVDRPVPVRTVRATRGKWLRAEPVAALYAEGASCTSGCTRRSRTRCACSAPTGWCAGAPGPARSLVWALTDLLIDAAAARHPHALTLL